MIVRAFALMYVEMKQLVQEHPELLKSTGHCFISIMVPETPAEELIFPPDQERWITLRFHDVTRRFQATMDRLNDQMYQGMSVEQADAIVDFLQRWHCAPQKIKLLVNCQAGVSRSAAVAVFARDQFALNTEQFADDNPFIRPNDLMLPLLRTRWQHRARTGQ